MTPKLYGIWRPMKGWWRGHNNDPHAFEDLEVAQSVADRYGEGARPEFIDASLMEVESERVLLEQEAKRMQAESNITLWNRIVRLFKS